MAFRLVADELVLGLIGTIERLQIKITDGDGNPVAATQLSFQLITLGGCVITVDDFVNPPVGGTRIINPSLGVYYFPAGDDVLVDPRLETTIARDLMAVWHVEVGSDADNFVQSFKVVTPYVMDLAGRLRRQIDKAAKLVHDDPEHPCYLGYTDKALIEFLEGGLSTWNEYQPYPMWARLEDFPILHRQGLIEAALIVGVQSQELFAIDQDVPNYSAQGASFVIQHQPQLAQFATRLSQKLDKLIPIAKLHWVKTGALHVQSPVNARINMLVQMAPSGALFRNMIFRS